MTHLIAYIDLAFSVRVRAKSVRYREGHGSYEEMEAVTVEEITFAGRPVDPVLAEMLRPLAEAEAVRADAWEPDE